MKTIHSMALFMALILLLGACQMNTEPKEAEAEKRTQIEMQTTQGTLLIELYNETPKHRDNFVKLAEEGAFAWQKYDILCDGKWDEI